ncbi:MAG TPA: DNA polymerase IV [Bacteroidales bacterium]|nr:DNA polymerase IV [Bacteroidales bacterium]
MRKIIHIDMDAFFASVEQLDNPSLRGKPVAVGGSGPRSVVAAASYEARRYGVRSAMPSVTAKRLCPSITFVRGRFERYQEESDAIFEIFSRYSDLIEPLSIDEAFLDVSKDKKDIGSATLIARAIREDIKRERGLTASAGVSYNKFLAKMASDINKPDGLFVILEEDAIDFIDSLKIDKFYGIGKVTAEKMHSLGIHFGRDLHKWDEESLVRNFGKAGSFFYDMVRGIDNRPVECESVRKSVGAETTFDKDLSKQFEIIAELYHIEEEVMRRVSEAEFHGRTVTLKIKFNDFRQITRSHTLLSYVRDFDMLHREVTALRKSLDLSHVKIRLLGVSISSLESGDRDLQLGLWE